MTYVDKRRYPGHTGIYFRVNRHGGFVFIASWPDPKYPGLTRWKAVGSSAPEAVAYRERMLANA